MFTVIARQSRYKKRVSREFITGTVLTMKKKIYSIKEIYRTLQGEGAMTGRVAVFLRFSGCNLWTGRESDRHKAICTFCDTDFVGTDGVRGGKYDAAALVEQVVACWEEGVESTGPRYVVCTGGEPGLQLDEALVDALHAAHFEVGIESNGTVALPPNLDWICISPKANAPLVTVAGSELKLVYPQELARPERFEHLAFTHFFLQPKDDPHQSRNIEETIAYCMAHPRWRLSLQTHKFIGIP